MGNIDAPVVAVADRERRARHGLRHAERAARTAHERRLPGAELPGDRDNVADVQVNSELRCELFRLFRGMRLGQKRPSWTAGCAVGALSQTGSGGGATSRPISSGMRAKSDLSTSSMRGV
jgi:hypothetical protein